ncbi:uncharacterized protein LOC120356901 [Solenopsis invicta]|uniref:uncharacterized protein LOC120356901 n=1 Tax=Solenopsis invicta TaxID=13686 RepID=UPI00193D0CBA|nr:uncharacterized protein LOC120356901 [Solenopsis invicta]
MTRLFLRIQLCDMFLRPPGEPIGDVVDVSWPINEHAQPLPHATGIKAASMGAPLNTAQYIESKVSGITSILSESSYVNYRQLSNKRRNKIAKLHRLFWISYWIDPLNISSSNLNGQFVFY